MQNLILVRSLIIQDLFKVPLVTNVFDFKAWVASGSYRITGNPKKDTIILDIYSEEIFCQMLSFDICRTATAAFETMENILATHSLPKSYAWLAIKMYYAAFFASHSVMRCFGYTCSQLEKGHTNILKNHLDVSGLRNSLKVDSGYFKGIYTPINREILIEKISSNTHEETWFWFLKCLEELSIKVLSVNGLSKDKQLLSAEIDDLINILKNHGKSSKGNFLSQFRNAINYRQEYAAWYPYGKTSVETSKIIGLVKHWRSETIRGTSIWKNAKDSYFFFLACVQIVNLSHNLIKIIDEHSDSKKNIYSSWPTKFLNLTEK